jgi:hypothetical protein
MGGAGQRPKLALATLFAPAEASFRPEKVADQIVLLRNSTPSCGKA